MGTLMPYEQYEDVLVGEPGWSDVRIDNVLFQTDGAVDVMSWEMTCVEGAAPLYYALARGPNGTTPCFAKWSDWGLKAKRSVTRP